MVFTFLMNCQSFTKHFKIYKHCKWRFVYVKVLKYYLVTFSHVHVCWQWLIMRKCFIPLYRQDRIQSLKYHISMKRNAVLLKKCNLLTSATLQQIYELTHILFVHLQHNKTKDLSSKVGIHKPTIKVYIKSVYWLLIWGLLFYL